MDIRIVNALYDPLVRCWPYGFCCVVVFTHACIELCFSVLCGGFVLFESDNAFRIDAVYVFGFGGSVDCVELTDQE